MSAGPIAHESCGCTACDLDDPVYLIDGVWQHAVRWSLCAAEHPPLQATPTIDEAKAKLCDRMAEALRPFAEAMVAHGDPQWVPDNHSVFHAIREGRLVITGVAVGGLREARVILAELAKVKT